MADSDDEYDRKRRDKFRGERSSGDNYRSDRRGGDDRGRGREDWNERGRNRPDYRDYRGRDRFSPDRGPPMKRMREWGDEGRPRYTGHDNFGGYGGGVPVVTGAAGSWGGHDHYGMHGAHGFPAGGGHPATGVHSRIGQDSQNNPELQTQPPMLTLKQFLTTQDDSISDSDAITKYNEYKLEFKRQQLNEFFVAHKDEEWFKMKYHPEESMKRKEEQLGFLRNRKDTFVYLLDNNYITSVSVDTTQNDALLKLLDITVINLEGGNEDDIKCLDEKEKQIEHSSISSIKSQHLLSTSSTTSTATAAAAAAVATFGKNEEDVIIVNSAPISSEKNWDDEITAVDKGKNVTDGDNWDDDELTEDKKDDIARKQIDEEIHNDKNQIIVKHKMDKKKFKKIRKKTNSESSNSSSSSSDSSDDDEDDDAEDNNIGADKATFNEYNKELDKNVENDINNINNNEKVKIYEIDGGVDEKLINNNDDQKTDDIQKDKVIESGDITGGDDGKTEQLNAEKPDADKAETIDLIQDIDTSMDKVMPRALHRTSSIFLRNLAPTITKSEVEAMCKRYSGFLRVAIADPLVDRRWFRRGWVTFIRDVNIKEICWNLNNIRLRDCELGAIVNRDLSRRIRPVNGITAHKTIVRNDIKLCARIAHNLDTKAGLWLRADDVIVTSENGTKTNNINMNVNRGDDQQSFGLHSNNPVLQNITDYLIEEASAEEDELLGLSVIESKDSEGEFLERDIDLIRVLDKLILYLRIVHSVDFYNHCEYPYEDEMPNRCGIIHARGPPPQNKVTPNEIQDYIRNFETKISSFLVKSQSIDESELKKIGCKDIDAELEKFVQVNTQELGKDKWLCPLSGKKFKGPEFIRKHIFNKHAEKVDEVKKEVEYFNAYLKDPKRPQLPENPGNIRKAPTNTDMQTPQTGFPNRYRPFPGPGYMQHYAGYAPPMIVPPRPRGGFGGRRGVNSEYRPIIHYRDLDAPREPDDFL